MPGTFTITTGDSLAVLPTYPADHFHSVITDPPYGIGFMGKSWDHGVPGVDFWRDALRVAKPGAHLAAFSSPRTFHRLGVAIEDAGWEIRDSLLWLYGNGFPKGLDIAKAIDKRRDDRAGVLTVTAFVRRARDAAGLTNADIDAHFGTNGMAGHWTSSKSQPAVPDAATWRRLLELLGVPLAPADIEALVHELNERKGEFGEAWHAREITGEVDEWTDRTAYALTSRDGLRRDQAHSAPALEWDGWNTALKPAWEPIILARKPFTGTVAANVLEHGTAAFNVDACRVKGGRVQSSAGGLAGYGSGNKVPYVKGSGAEFHDRGRYPANVILDDEAARQLDAQSGDTRGGSPVNDHPSESTARTYGDYNRRKHSGGYADTGGASRFFYTAKASTDERDAGCEELFWQLDAAGNYARVTFDAWEALTTDERTEGNPHPTVKPLDLMRWLVKLLTPADGRTLDLFAGSGSTVCAAVLEGMDAHGIELSPENAAIARARAAHWQAGGGWAVSAPNEPQQSLFDSL